MTPFKLEIADIIGQYGSAYSQEYATSFGQQKVLKNLVMCRTEALGGHVKECDTCDHKEVYYNSCRDRHCPKCKAAARATWLEDRAADLLPNVQYFHVVFTIPDKFSSLALQNKRLFYGILFRAVSETLRVISRDPKHLGAEIGFLAILHTWGQTLLHHPHIHCLIPGGGISTDGNQWIHCREGFFLPVRVLSSLFQKKLLAYIKKAYKKGEWVLHGKLADLKKKKSFQKFLSPLYDMNWNVYAKPPFGDSLKVLKYLARYTHRVAISNQRLVSLKDGKVSFRWKDYRNGNANRIMTLDAVEFIRRFLMHVLPSGFMCIRHYGFLSNRVRKEKLRLCRQLLEDDDAIQTSSPLEQTKSALIDLMEDARTSLCPVCKKGRLSTTQSIFPLAKERLRLTLFLRKETG